MIVVVSGLPRSGTSLMMQMLAAGGLPVLTDGVRTADAHNERGYYEWEPVKQLPRNPGLIAEAEGKVVKVISSLLASLERTREYRVLFMIRPVKEIVRSQTEMIRTRGSVGAALTPETMAKTLETHRSQTLAWLASQPHITHITVEYKSLVEGPADESARIAAFLGLPLETAQMTAAVDASLWHQKWGEL
jgi:hypothetical protein